VCSCFCLQEFAEIYLTGLEHCMRTAAGSRGVWDNTPIPTAQPVQPEFTDGRWSLSRNLCVFCLWELEIPAGSEYTFNCKLQGNLHYCTTIYRTWMVLIEYVHIEAHATSRWFVAVTSIAEAATYEYPLKHCCSDSWNSVSEANCGMECGPTGRHRLSQQ
jgi:hypothetical protein